MAKFVYVDDFGEEYYLDLGITKNWTAVNFTIYRPVYGSWPKFQLGLGGEAYFWLKLDICYLIFDFSLFSKNYLRY